MKEKLDLYRRGVGILILGPNNHVWVGRRICHHNDKNKSSCSWQMPQGGINPQESSLDAAYRELYEETGIKSVSLLGESDSYVKYDFPKSYIRKNGYIGQIQKWFAFRFHGSTSEICVDRTSFGYESEFDAWAWVSLLDTPNIVVDFKKKSYQQIVPDFVYLIK
ncbi:dinucleoside polyphosphate hydrolase [Candidatus Liberibacter africanus PTSAPSY]|uniref:Dinucleoside polyphosphate hydrolase n=1 Tax=Candidatus Liberibacter africanus PTSAPSY TaxID=1277257 RepID=A0A0G3I379_LIBAF|nr:dinucleoside polyphosphate hydrolase [Candidatus Liberibacter africanus PTSAPSY]